ncbi:DUF4350 domain-containing protein [Halorussus halobius]|uniref:DUF4350 domain-containing protein n=1 Tax=Halorussus halobius TaxID=1710537 RepID=UPI001FCE4E01|nr:DUF4350 domain-containing protein [Halorussus halobius]
MSDRATPTIPQVALAALTLAVVAAVVVAGTTSSAAFGPYNANWEGTTELRSVAGEAGADVSVVRGTAGYASTPADGTVAFVLSPESAYSPAAASRVADFVRSGGTLVVADDVGGRANGLLRSVNASARVNGTPLRDAGSNYRSPAMPVATGVANHSLVAGVESLTLNYGTAVDPRGATPLVNTSGSAYLDADRDGDLGPNESLATYPVATVERVGDGRVVAVGDPSLFINAMLDRPGNRRFVRVLAVQHDRALFDASHSASLPPLRLALLAVRESAPLQFGLVALAVGALAVWSRRPDLSLRALADARGTAESTAFESVDASGLAAHLERRNPEWDRERVERVAESLERTRKR